LELILPLHEVLPDELGRAHVHGWGGAQKIRGQFIRGLMVSPKLAGLTILTGKDRVSQVRHQVETLEQARPVRVASFSEFAAGSKPHCAVIQCTEPALARAAHFSLRFGNSKWPICGMTHDLLNPEVIQDLRLLQFVSPRPPLAIACASPAARQACKSLVQQASVFEQLQIALPVIQHGIEQAPVKGLASAARPEMRLGMDEFVLLYLGRLSSATKADLPTLIAAFRSFSATRPATLILAGSHAEAETRKLLHQAAAESQSPKRIVIRENISESEKASLLAVADVFVSPVNSLQESFGLGIVEAMQHRLPIIATDWNGYRRLLRHGESAILIPTTADRDAMSRIGDLATLESAGHLHQLSSAAVKVSLSHLIKAMEVLEKDRKLAAALGQSAETAAKHLTITRMIDRYLRMWHMMLGMCREISAPYSTLSTDIARSFLFYPSSWV